MALLGNIQYSSEVINSSISCTWTLPSIFPFTATECSTYRSEVFHLIDRPFQWEMCFPPDLSWPVYSTITLLCKSSGNDIRGTFSGIIAEIRDSNGSVLERTFNDERIEAPSCRDTIVISLTTMKHELIPKAKDDTTLIHFAASYEYNVPKRGILKFTDDEVCDHLQLSKDFGTLYETENMTDAVVVVQDTEIKVHTAVLAARSKVLATMFKRDFLEGQTRRIQVIDFSLDTIKCMLKFLYTASLDELDVDKALDLLRAADKYDVPSLTSRCCKFLLGQIDEKSAIPILISADMFSIAELKEKSLDYLTMENSPVSIDEHKSLLDTRPSILYEIIHRFKKL